MCFGFFFQNQDNDSDGKNIVVGLDKKEIRREKEKRPKINTK